MNKWTLHHWLCSIVIATLVSACSNQDIKPHQNIDQNNIDTLIQNKRYDAAIEKLKSHNSPREQIEKLLASRSTYESTLVKNIKAAVKKNQFLNAEKLFQEGLANIPSSEKLYDAGSLLQSKQNEKLDRYQLQHDEARAAFLIKELPILKNMLKTKSSAEIDERISQHQLEAQMLANKIGQAGLQSLKRKHLKSAKRQLRLALRLKNNETWKTALNRISQKKRIDNQAQLLEKEKASQEAFAQLQLRFEQAMSSGDLQDARNSIEALDNTEAKDQEWITSAKARYSRTLKASLDIALKKGQLLYSKGKIAEAISVWKEALQHSPNDSKLQENINRAEKFQKKFQQLQQP